MTHRAVRQAIGAPLNVYRMGIMTIRFRTAVASARGAFMEGQTVQVAGFPQEWQSWLDAGLLEVLPETSGERAVTDPPAYAVSPRGGGRGRRTAAVA